MIKFNKKIFCSISTKGILFVFQDYELTTTKLLYLLAPTSLSEWPATRVRTHAQNQPHWFYHWLLSTQDSV